MLTQEKFSCFSLFITAVLARMPIGIKMALRSSLTLSMLSKSRKMLRWRSKARTVRKRWNLPRRRRIGDTEHPLQQTSTSCLMTGLTATPDLQRHDSLKRRSSRVLTVLPNVRRRSTSCESAWPRSVLKGFPFRVLKYTRRGRDLKARTKSCRRAATPCGESRNTGSHGQGTSG